MQKFKSESIAAGERAYAVNIEANHNLKSSEKEVKLIPKALTSSAEGAVKMTVNTNKDERV